MKKYWHCLWMLPLAVFLVVGCGKEPDTNKPSAEVKKEVEGMSVSDLKSSAQAYAKEITNKTGEMKKIQEKLKGLSPKDLLGEEAKGIKEAVSKVGTELKALTQRYDIYAKQFKQSGGDLSAIKIG